VDLVQIAITDSPASSSSSACCDTVTHVTLDLPKVVRLFQAEQITAQPRHPRHSRHRCYGTEGPTKNVHGPCGCA